MPLTWDATTRRWRLSPGVDADPAAIAMDAFVGAGRGLMDAADMPVRFLRGQLPEASDPSSTLLVSDRATPTSMALGSGRHARVRALKGTCLWRSQKAIASEQAFNRL